MTLKKLLDVIFGFARHRLGALTIVIIAILMVVTRQAKADDPEWCIKEISRDDDKVVILHNMHVKCDLREVVRRYPQLDPATKRPLPMQVQMRSIYAANQAHDENGEQIGRTVKRGCAGKGPYPEGTDEEEKTSCPGEVMNYYSVSNSGNKYARLVIPTKRKLTRGELAEKVASAACLLVPAEKASDKNVADALSRCHELLGSSFSAPVASPPEKASPAPEEQNSKFQIPNSGGSLAFKSALAAVMPFAARGAWFWRLIGLSIALGLTLGAVGYDDHRRYKLDKKTKSQHEKDRESWEAKHAEYSGKLQLAEVESAKQKTRLASLQVDLDAALRKLAATERKLQSVGTSSTSVTTPPPADMVARVQYDELMQNYNVAVARYNEAAANLAKLEESSTKLAERNHQLLAAGAGNDQGVADLRAECRRYQDENASLVARTAELESLASELRASVDTLSAENSRLVAENNEYQGTVADFRASLTGQPAEVERDALQKKLGDIERIGELERRVSQLVAENQELGRKAEQASQFAGSMGNFNRTLPGLSPVPAIVTPVAKDEEVTVVQSSKDLALSLAVAQLLTAEVETAGIVVESWRKIVKEISASCAQQRVRFESSPNHRALKSALDETERLVSWLKDTQLSYAEIRLGQLQGIRENAREDYLLEFLSHLVKDSERRRGEPMFEIALRKISGKLEKIILLFDKHEEVQAIRERLETAQSALALADEKTKIAENSLAVIVAELESQARKHESNTFNGLKTRCDRLEWRLAVEVQQHGQTKRALASAMAAPREAMSSGLVSQTSEDSDSGVHVSVLPPPPQDVAVLAQVDVGQEDAPRISVNLSAQVERELRLLDDDSLMLAIETMIRSILERRRNGRSLEYDVSSDDDLVALHEFLQLPLVSVHPYSLPVAVRELISEQGEHPGALARIWHAIHDSCALVMGAGIRKVHQPTLVPAAPGSKVSGV